MIRLYQKGQNVVTKCELPVNWTEFPDLIWIDIQNPPLEEIEEIETHFKLDIPTRLQQEEIESSSRYLETDDYIIANSTFLQAENETHFENIHVSFVIKGDLLVTYREGLLRSFAECVKKIKTNHKPFTNGRMILLALFETRVDFDADLIESISRKISIISKELTNNHGPQAELLKQITTYQESTMFVRENVIDKQRVVSSLLRSGEFIEDEKERLRIILRDINSLIDHTNFLFERLEYLQDTFLGLVNIDQNKIIKIFTVVTVIFMPPTLIASLYGMNFKFIPELEWGFGYPFAIALMVGSSLLTLLFFKKKKWL
jgi:magnesium Mg(2+) and cobalt Co(2+) transport protein (corA)